VRTSHLAVALLALSACSTESEMPRVVGTLERDRIEIVSEEAEPILEIEVREGDHVEQGQVLVRQATELAAARLANADAHIAEARYRLMELERGARVETIDEARARVAAARATAARDESELRRAEELVKQRLVSQSQLDQARAARDASAAALREAEARLTELLRGTRAEQIEQARAALAAAESARKELEVTDSRLLVRATRSGIVEALPYEVGERPPRGSPVAILLSDTSVYARVYVPEPLRVHMRAGSRARVFVDGLEQPLDGVVRFVAAEAAFTPYFALTQRDRSRLAFLAEIDIEGEQARNLPAGVPVEVELVRPESG
jgi:HlyD family secretion protein